MVERRASRVVMASWWERSSMAEKTKLVESCGTVAQKLLASLFPKVTPGELRRAPELPDSWLNVAER